MGPKAYIGAGAGVVIGFIATYHMEEHTPKAEKPRTEYSEEC